MTLRAPFPWFGGKSRVAAQVWEAFGDVGNYVEPFFGSGAVLLGRPGEPRIETVNDLDCYVSNFWRAVHAAPDEVAHFADWPVNEADLHARHRWLVDQGAFREAMKTNPHFYDARIAGWWVWGICQWIGGGWCVEPKHEGRTNAGRAPRGINRVTEANRPGLSPRGVHARGNAEWSGRPAGQAMGINAPPRKLPALSHTGPGVGVHSGRRPSLGNHGGGMGVHSGGKRKRNVEDAGDWRKRPALDRGGRGVSRQDLSQQLPAIDHGIVSRGTLWNQHPDLSGSRGAAGRGIHASGKPSEGVYAWMSSLCDRLRRVRVCCGDWQRVLGPAVTTGIALTGVFLDPPYSDDADRDPSLYSCDDLEVAHAVRAWAIEHGDDPKMRIALCGYEGEHEMPASWRKVAWKANGGYAGRNKDNQNAHRERIWFSPHCHGSRQASLFG